MITSNKFARDHFKFSQTCGNIQNAICPVKRVAYSAFEIMLGSCAAGNTASSAVVFEQQAKSFVIPKGRPDLRWLENRSEVTRVSTVPQKVNSKHRQTSRQALKVSRIALGVGGGTLYSFPLALECALVVE